MKKLLLILSAILAFNKLSICDPIAQMYKKDPWKYMEYVFIINPELKMKKISNRLIQYGLAGTAGVAGFLITNKIKDKILLIDDSTYDLSKNGDRVRFGLSKTINLIGIVIPSLITYFIVKALAKNKFETENLVSFVRDWQNNKIGTPTELHESFDILEQSLIHNPNIFSEKAFEFIFNIKNKIYAKFPNKYPSKTSKKDFFTFKLFNLDVGGTLTGIANLIKAIFR